MGTKLIKSCGDQGDIRLYRVGEVPTHVERVECGGRAIVAHSETGHHHVVESPGAAYFTDPKDPFTAYLSLAEDAQVTHLRPFDTHAPISLTAGVWGIRRQREYVPEGFRMVQD
jgi:hypothetical protein